MQQEKNHRILLVDDEAETLRILQLILRSRGYAVEEALSAEEGLRLLRHGPPFAMVLTDFFMPGMDGGRFLEAIRAEWADLPVILMTAYCARKVLQDLLDHPCNGFIQKPFKIEDLMAEIKRLTTSVKDGAGEQGVL